MLKSYALITAVVSTLILIPAEAQIAEKMRGEHWIEAGGNTLVKVYLLPKFVTKKDDIHSLVVKWHYNKTISSINSQISMIKINCRTNEWTSEYVETYSGDNLDGALVNAGQYPTPLKWDIIGDADHAYTQTKNLICN